MNVRKTAETLEAMGRILREAPADVQVLSVILNADVVGDGCGVAVHLDGGVTTLAGFYGAEIRSEYRPKSKFTEFYITVDGVKVFTLKKTTKGQ